MLKDVIGALFLKPVTQKYPFERTQPSERLRGKLVWDPEKCTGCALCVKDCPSDAIEMVVNDKQNKNFVLRYHMDRCTFCAQCVQNCRFECMGMSDEEVGAGRVEKGAFHSLLRRREPGFCLPGDLENKNRPEDCPEPADPAAPIEATGSSA